MDRFRYRYTCTHTYMYAFVYTYICTYIHIFCIWYSDVGQTKCIWATWKPEGHGRRRPSPAGKVNFEMEELNRCCRVRALSLGLFKVFRGFGLGFST